MTSDLTHPTIDFLVIGSQKSATSWLYNCLNEHPEIQMPAKKREVEYIGGELFRDGGYEWYESLLDWSNQAVYGDVSVEYIVNPASAELVYRRYPNIKLILVIRDPVSRALSAYQWYVRKGNIENNQEKALKAFKHAVEEYDPEMYQLNQFDFIDILHRGNYDYLIKSYMKHFNEEQIALLDYRDIECNNKEALEFIYTFIGVNRKCVPQSLLTRPKQNSNSSFLVWLERSYPKSRLINGIIDRLHQWIIKYEGKPKLKGTDANPIATVLNDFYRDSFLSFKERMAIQSKCIIFKRESWVSK